MADLVPGLHAGGSDHWIIEGGNWPKMKLWCPPCRTVHAFALADVERIVGSLQLTGGGPRKVQCLEDHLAAAESWTTLGKHVEQCVSAREAHSRAADQASNYR